MKALISIKRLIIVTLLLISSSMFAQKTDAPWQSLFNGVNLDEWKMVGDKGEAFVEDGEILLRQVGNTKNHTYLTSVEKYSDFILEADFKMEAPGWSSGILIRCFEEKIKDDTTKMKLYGYQIKIDNSARNWTGGIFHDYGGSVKWLYDLSNNEPAREAFKTNDWNTFRIEAIGNNIKVWLNGVPSANLINNQFPKGYIALKIHSLGAEAKDKGALVRYKNIRIVTKNVTSFAQTSNIQQITVE